MRLIAFCEARSDFEIASDLIDRVLREKGQPWVADVLDVAPEGIRTWALDSNGSPFFDLHRIDDYVRTLGVRPRYGHFDGKPRAAGAGMAANVFQIVRRLLRRGESLDAVVLVWDMDDQDKDRTKGLDQARAEAERWELFAVAVGRPNAMREAWVLVGFSPVNNEESARFDGMRTELGRAPNANAHLLNAKDEQAKGSAKRVLRLLTAEDRDRERRCWLETPLKTLVDRSAKTGLAEFIDEVEQRIVPLCVAHGPRPR